MIYEAVAITEDGLEHKDIEEVKLYDMKYTLYVKIVDADGEVLAKKPCNHQLHLVNTIKKLERDGDYLLETIQTYGVGTK
jgi:hypothetical protein